MTHPNDKQEDKSPLVRERTTEGCAQTGTPRRSKNTVQEFMESAYRNGNEAQKRINELETELNQARAEAQRLLGVDAKLKDALLEVERLKDALKWYAHFVGDCNKTDAAGNTARHMLATDHGKKAEAAMAEQPVNSSPERETVANCEQGGQE